MDAVVVVWRRAEPLDAEHELETKVEISYNARGEVTLTKALLTRFLTEAGYVKDEE